MKKRIAVIGSGNWGTTVAGIVSANIEKYDCFHDEVLLWVFEEMYQNQKLSEYINAFKSNPIYLAGVRLPENIRAVTTFDLVEDCDIILICIPLAFLKTLEDLKVKKDAFAINLAKGIIIEDKKLYMPSEYLGKMLGINCCCLMGANIANEVAREDLSDCTIGYTKKDQIDYLDMMFENDYFRPKILPYDKGMEVCGGLKNVISIGFGMAEGLEWGSNTKSMIFRQGLIEIERFCKLIGAKFMILESCCVGDLLTSCLSGRNFNCGLKIAREKSSVEEIERSMRGQKLQGPATCKSIHGWLIANNHNMSQFPIIEAIYRICYENEICEHLRSVLKKCQS